jgi:demethylmenaquinone methyltransferase/2-methoxy-6-polyprenyl-1,4-benzoquinol methylase
MPLFDHFSLIAPYYEGVFGAGMTDRLLDLVDPEPGQRLLDIGGGTGRIAQRFVGRVGHVCVLDPAPGMARESQGKGICIVRAECEQLPFPQAVFDRILVVDAFHHFRDQEQAAGEMARVLRPGGRVIVEEPDIDHVGVKAVAVAEKLLLMRSHFCSPDAIRRIFVERGLQASIEREGYTSWIVAARSL